MKLYCAIKIFWTVSSVAPYLIERGQRRFVVISVLCLKNGHVCCGITSPRRFRVNAPMEQLWHEALRWAEEAGVSQQLASEGWRPDRVLAHCGWGEALPVKEQWPRSSAGMA